MKKYRYDPILCMNVPDSTSKAKDADMFVQLRFSSGKTEGAKLDPNEFREYAEALLNKYKEKQVTISKNGKVLATYINRNVRDVSLVGMRDTKIVDENYIVSGMKSQLEQMLKRYKDPKNRNQLVSQYIGIVNNHRANGKVTEEEFNEFVKYAKGLIGGSHDSLDKAIMACDSTQQYNRYYNSIRDENYETASRLFRQAEQDDELTDQEIDKLLLFFKSKFGKGPR